MNVMKHSHEVDYYHAIPLLHHLVEEQDKSRNAGADGRVLAMLASVSPVTCLVHLIPLGNILFSDGPRGVVAEFTIGAGESARSPLVTAQSPRKPIGHY